MEAKATMDRHRNLERQLGAIMAADQNYPQLKTLVIIAYASAQALGTMPNYLAVAKVLGLDERATKELKQLHSEVIRPMEVSFFDVRNEFIGVYTGRLVWCVNEASESRKETVMRAFTGQFISLTKKAGVDKSPNIKAVILYPLLIASLNTWRKHNYKFAGMMIDSIKAVEEDPELKGIIETIDIPIGLRNTNS